MTSSPGPWPITDDLTVLRARVLDYATRVGLSSQRAEDLMLSVSEAAANVLEHGGGRGTVRVWLDRGDVVVDITDAYGVLAPHHARRQRPPDDARRGFGLWLMRQMCDDISIDQRPGCSRLRLRMSLPS